MKLRTRRAWPRCIAIAAALLATASLVAALMARDELDAARERLESARRVVETDLGTVAYEMGGQGPVVLVLHGAGGGHDQGRLIAEALLGDGVRWIAPSRFGYPGSPLPDDASTAAQADALAAMLDAVGAPRAHVLGFSGGAPPALQLASQYPGRVDRLVLVSSAPFTPFSPDVEGRALPASVYRALLGSDTVYWVLTRTLRGRLLEAFDARPALLDLASDDERAFANAVVTTFLPPSLRREGIVNEVAAVDPGAVYDLENIVAPTLVIHSRDDRLNPISVAETVAARIPGARLEVFHTGGHLLLGRHEEVRGALRGFLDE